MSIAQRIRIGTRGSKLARWQSDWVAERLRELSVDVEIIEISTQGDVQSVGPIESLGGTGVFTKEIQRALLDGAVDLAVHSLKDLPTEPVPGLVLAAVPQRERCGDALICREGYGIDELPPGSLIGTGSFRRQAQLKHWRPDLRVDDIRGNVETRLRKLDDGQFDAIVLAEAGLLRLGLAERITQVLPKEKMLPAIGQGALGLETRENDAPVRQALAALDDTSTHAAILAERSLLATLRGGCLAPVGAWARVDDDGQLKLNAVVLDRAGAQRLEAMAAGKMEDAAELGRQAAQQLIENGASDLIQASRQQ
jgi:hydroxymethylbilane synthase